MPGSPPGTRQPPESAWERTSKEPTWQVLRGTEDMLLWRHRVETGLSAEANYGRFYPGYARSTNRWIVRGGRAGTRSPGRRAAPLPEDEPRREVDLSHPVLQGEGGPLHALWWTRASLQGARDLPAGPAVYCIHDGGAKEAAYIGEPLRWRHGPRSTPLRRGGFGRQGLLTFRCRSARRSTSFGNLRVTSWAGTSGGPDGRQRRNIACHRRRTDRPMTSAMKFSDTLSAAQIGRNIAH
jgi:hypothetical protein